MLIAKNYVYFYSGLMLHNNSLTSKLRIGVIMGGRSIENEASFNSGRTICDHLDTARYEAVPIYQSKEGNLFLLPAHFLHRGKTTDFAHRLAQEAEQLCWDELPKRIDFMYIATHGRFAEDGTLQGFLEIFNIPYLGAPVFASALRMNKIMQKKYLHAHQIQTPAFVVIHPEDLPNITPDYLQEKLTHAQISAPYIVKPASEGSSLGVSLVHTIDQLPAAIQKAARVSDYAINNVLIEQHIAGMEFTCITLEDYKEGKYISLVPTEVVPNETGIFDYEQKYMPGKATKFTPARCSADIVKKIQETCIRVTQIMEFKTISRIDGIVTPTNDIFIIDCNSLSAMGPFSFLFVQAAEHNMSHTQVINHLIETELHHLTQNNTTIYNENSVDNHIPKKRIAVLLGGASNEREISLESGRNVLYKLSPQKYEAIALFVSSDLQLYKINQSLLVRNSTREIEALLTPEMRMLWNDLPTIADFVFVGLHGGEGENGTVQGILEMLNMPYNGSGVLSSALCMDKYKLGVMLQQENIAVPRNVFISKQQWLLNQEEELNYIITQLPFPLIVKPHNDGCSVMVQKADTAAELINAIELLFANKKESALIEEYITGMEITVGVLGNDKIQVLPPSQAISNAGVLSIEEKFLPGAGENQTPAPLPPQTLQFIQHTIAAAYKAADCRGYARIDAFYQNAQQSPTGSERVVILEINTLPGLTPATCIFHQAAEIGLKPMDFIDTIIQLGFEAHSVQRPDERMKNSTSLEMG